MNKAPYNRSRETLVILSTLLLVVFALTVSGCSDQATNTGLASDADIAYQAASPRLTASDTEVIEGPMQISPHVLNLQSKGTAESVRAIVGLAIPANYHLSDFDFTLSFNDEEVTKAYDCYYCYVDNNLIISFDKSEVLSSPVTIGFANTEVQAAVNGYFRVESDDDGYDTWLSTVAAVEIINPSRADQVRK